MADHDQRFKQMLTEFLPEFFELFFPAWAGRFDFTPPIRPLQQEAFLDPPRGERRTLDLVFELPLVSGSPHPQTGVPVTAETPCLTLVHAEIESQDDVSSLPRRFFHTVTHLDVRHGKPVLPVALYLRVARQGRGREVHELRFWDRTPVRFEYDYVGLPGLPGEVFAAGENLLGVALSPLMRVERDRRAQLTADALLRLAHSDENPARKFLLSECVQAYSPMDQEQKDAFARLLEQQAYKGIEPMNQTWYERDVEASRKEGERKGKLFFLERVLETKFGALPEPTKQKLRVLPEETIDQLAADLVRANSLEELGLTE